MVIEEVRRIDRLGAVADEDRTRGGGADRLDHLKLPGHRRVKLGQLGPGRLARGFGAARAIAVGPQDHRVQRRHHRSGIAAQRHPGWVAGQLLGADVDADHARQVRQAALGIDVIIGRPKLGADRQHLIGRRDHLPDRAKTG